MIESTHSTIEGLFSYLVRALQLPPKPPLAMLSITAVLLPFIAAPQWPTSTFEDLLVEIAQGNREQEAGQDGN